MYARKHELFRHSIGLVTVRAYVQRDDDADISDLCEEAREACAYMQAYGTIVEVSKNGHVIGESSLWGSFVEDGWADPCLRTVAYDIAPDALHDARRTLGRL